MDKDTEMKTQKRVRLSKERKKSILRWRGRQRERDKERPRRRVEREQGREK